jgi:hypothetical protein
MRTALSPLPHGTARCENDSVNALSAHPLPVLFCARQRRVDKGGGVGKSIRTIILPKAGKAVGNQARAGRAARSARDGCVDSAPASPSYERRGKSRFFP